MMEFTQNYLCQRYIVNINKILTKQGTDMIQDVIPNKCQKYPSTRILKHVNVLDKLNKLSWGSLHHMIPHDACSIPIHIRTVILADIHHKKRSKIPLSDKQYSKENKAIVQLFQNICV